MASVAVAAAFSWAWCAVATRIGPSLGFIDVPDDPSLKAHERPAVPLGGVGVFLGVHVALVVGGRFDAGLFAASAMLLLLGLVDDRRGLPPLARLAVEVGAAVVLIIGSDSPLDASSPVDLVVGVIVVVAFVNAVNLFDGLDGLVGVSGGVTALGVGILAAERGSDPTLGVVLAAALAGFVLLNRHPARVFLGDNGAYTVGMFLAYGTLIASPNGVGVGLGIALVGMGVFGLDMAATVIRRKLSGRPILLGDRSHLYDQLCDRGMQVPAVALTSAGAQVLFVVAVIGLELADIGNWSWLVIAMLVFALLAGLNLGGFLRPAQAG